MRATRRDDRPRIARSGTRAAKTEKVELRKPIWIPVVDTARAQADALMRAYHALSNGVYSAVCVDALPGWPGPEGLDDMRRKVVLAARQCLNRLNIFTNQDTLHRAAPGDELILVAEWASMGNAGAYYLHS